MSKEKTPWHNYLWTADEIIGSIEITVKVLFWLAASYAAYGVGHYFHTAAKLVS